MTEGNQRLDLDLDLGYCPTLNFPSPQSKHTLDEWGCDINVKRKMNGD